MAPHSLIELVWHLLTTDEVFEDLGDDYFCTRSAPLAKLAGLLIQLEALGLTVTIAAA